MMYHFALVAVTVTRLLVVAPEVVYDSVTSGTSLIGTQYANVL